MFNIVPPEPCSRQIPPASNTGGNSSSSSSLPPVTFPHRVAIVDTLTFTLPIVNLSDDVAISVMHDAEAISEALCRAFLDILDLSLGESTGQRKNGYVDSAPIISQHVDPETNGAASLGYVAWGGNRNKLGQDTLCIYLTGACCEHVNLLDDMANGGIWYSLYLAMVRHSAKITRLDCAHDDLEGSHGGVDAAVGAYHSGGFTVRRTPSVRNSGDWINGHGRTFYVGKRDNGKLVRVYEKGHQLGDDESLWVRYELELHSKDRVIPLDAILRPAELLAGACSYMAGLLSTVTPTPVKTVVKHRLRVALDKLVACCKSSYGRVINAMEGAGLSSDEIIDSLRRDGLPARMYVPPAAVSA